MNATLDSLRTAAESVPTAWTPADEAFFRLVAEALPPAYLLGASVLLASYDREPDAGITASGSTASGSTASAGTA